jgi:hypothetical protein
MSQGSGPVSQGYSGPAKFENQNTKLSEILEPLPAKIFQIFHYGLYTFYQGILCSEIKSNDFFPEKQLFHIDFGRFESAGNGRRGDVAPLPHQSGYF